MISSLSLRSQSRAFQLHVFIDSLQSMRLFSLVLWSFTRSLVNKIILFPPHKLDFLPNPTHLCLASYRETISSSLGLNYCFYNSPSDHRGPNTWHKLSVSYNPSVEQELPYPFYRGSTWGLGTKSHSRLKTELNWCPSVPATSSRPTGSRTHLVPPFLT